MEAEVPNIQRVSDAFSVITKESAKFGNIPAFDQGIRLLEAIERLQRRVEQMDERTQQELREVRQAQTQMQRTMQQTSDRLDRLETRIIASNRNAAARTQNSVVSFADRRLAPLVSSLAGADIAGFPDTAATLSRLQNATVDRILLALEYGTAGSLEEKRDRLRHAIGLKLGGV